MLALDVVQFLSLDDVLEAAFVAVTFEFAKQVKLMTLELLDTLIERRDRVEHLIVFILELETLFLCLGQLLLDHQDLLLEGAVATLFLI